MFKEIEDMLKVYYGIKNAVITSQNGGWSALAYKVIENNEKYFLKKYEKSRASTVKLVKNIDCHIQVLRELNEKTVLKGKIPFPVLTINGSYRCEDEKGIYVLYKYIEGETVANNKLTPVQIERLAFILANLHMLDKNQLRSSCFPEEFDISFVEQLEKLIEVEANEGNCQSKIYVLINEYSKILMNLIDKIRKLQLQIKNEEHNMVLCHCDIHNWNLMVKDKELILIDWEGVKIAPIEVDLSLILDLPYAKQFFTEYKKLNTNISLNNNLLLFYKIRRKLEDIWEFAEQLLFDKQNEQTAKDILDSIQSELDELVVFNMKIQ